MLYFEYLDLHFDVKNFSYSIFTTCSAKIGPKIKKASKLFKFGIFNISNIPILIFM